MLENVKKQKKAEFVVNWNIEDYYAVNKDKKKDDLSNSMKEALLNDGGYVSNSPIKVWKKSLLDNPKRINVPNTESFNNNNMASSTQEHIILSGNHVMVKGFEIGKVIIRNRNKEKKVNDLISIKNEFKDKEDNKVNLNNNLIPEKSDIFNKEQSIQVWDNELNSLSLCKNDINMPYLIISQLDNIKEVLSLIPLIILGILFVFYNIKSINNDNFRFYSLSLLPLSNYNNNLSLFNYCDSVVQNISKDTYINNWLKPYQIEDPFNLIYLEYIKNSLIHFYIFVLNEIIVIDINFLFFILLLSFGALFIFCFFIYIYIFKKE